MALFGLFGKKRSQPQPLPDDDLEVVKLWQKATAEEDWSMVYRCAERLTANGFAFEWSLGECYLYGRGVAKDTKRALYHFENAANEGSAQDATRYAVLLTEGRLVEPNPAKALYLFRRAASYDESYACLYLYRLQTAGQLPGHQYTEDELAMMLLNAAIDNEPGARELFRTHAETHSFTAWSYANMSHIAAKSGDDEQRLEYTRLAAAYGHEASLYNLGFFHKNGIGTFPYSYLAIRYLQGAAELYNDADAMFSLGLLYQKERKTPENEENMIQWFTRAAEAGHGSAANNLAVYYQKKEEQAGFGSTYKQTLYWFHRAAELGNATAMYNLYNVYNDGVMVMKDTAKADEYLQKAAELGHEAAVLIMEVRRTYQK